MDNPGVRCSACVVVSSCRVFVRRPLCRAVERALAHFGLLRKVPAQRARTPMDDPRLREHPTCYILDRLPLLGFSPFHDICISKNQSLDRDRAQKSCRNLTGVAPASFAISLTSTVFGISRATEEDGGGGISPAGDEIIIDCENLTSTLDVNVSGTKELWYSPAERGGAGSCVLVAADMLEQPKIGTKHAMM